MKRLSRWLVFVFAGLVLFPSDGSAQAPYYAGKTITVIEGNSAGGTTDLRTKSIMQFLQKYIPGNPTIVTQYVPGGGGRQAANQIYRAAADGLTIGASSPGVLSSAVLGETGVKYDPYTGKDMLRVLPNSTNYSILSGKSPGSHRAASAAGNARRSGARALSDWSTPLSTSAEMMRRAWRSPVPTMAAISPRGSSPR